MKRIMKDIIEMEGNEAKHLQVLISRALRRSESGADGLPTGVMIELPDGQVVPVSYAWYDSQRDMIRLSYEEE